MAAEIGRDAARLLSDVDVDVVSDVTRDPPRADEIDFLVCNRFPAALFGRMPRLRWLQLTGVGVDHVPEGEPRPGVVVSHAGDIPAAAVADHVLFGMLYFARAAPTLVDDQRARAWRLPDAIGMRGRTVVIVGFGRIGRAVAVRARGFGMHIVAVRNHAEASPLADETHPPSALPQIAARADYLVASVPSAADTIGLVSRAIIESLPASAVVVNVARANVVDVGALTDALRAGRVRGALLDVHEREPLPPDDPMWTVPRLLITPHCAFQYTEQAQDLAQLVVDNARLVLGGERPRNFAFVT